MPDSTPARPSISQMADQIGASIVQIKTFNKKDKPIGSGTGFFIDNRGSLVTNHHVLERCDRALIITENGNKGKIARIIKDDLERDLLVAETTFNKTLPIPFHPANEVSIHEDVIYFGNLEKTSKVISMGRVIDIIPVNDFLIMKISAPILPGASGSPVLNQDGELIAIATAYLDLEKSHFFAVPAAYLQDLKAVNFNLSMLPVRSAELGATIQGRKLIGLGLYKFQQSSLTVYFKDGRHKPCDRAWMEGDTVFLVMRGKAFAVGYHKDEIDMQKSFGY